MKDRVTLWYSYFSHPNYKTKLVSQDKTYWFAAAVTATVWGVWFLLRYIYTKYFLCTNDAAIPHTVHGIHWFGNDLWKAISRYMRSNQILSCLLPNSEFSETCDFLGVYVFFLSSLLLHNISHWHNTISMRLM